MTIDNVDCGQSVKEELMNVKVIVGLGLVVVLVLAFVFLVPVEDGMNADNSQKNLKQTDITSSQQPEKLPESVRPPTKSPFQHSSSKPETGHQTVSPADDKPARLVKPPVDPQPPESPSPDKKALPKLEQGPTPLRALLESDGATEKNLVLHGKKISQDEIDRLMVWGTDRDSLQGADRKSVV